MHLHELVDRHRSRKHEQHQIYRTILQDVFRKIKEKDDQQMYNLIYRVPSVVYGNPNYKSKTCIVYIINKLVKNEFVSFPYKDNLLYVDWSIVRSMIVEKPKVHKDRRKVSFALPFKE